MSRFRLDFVTWVCLLCGFNAYAQEPSVVVFSDELIEPIRIHTALIHSDRLTQLSSGQQESLLGARAVIGEFFRNLERLDGDPRRFMTDEYARRSGDRQSIRQALVDYETSVLQIGVTDFSLVEGGALELSLYVRVFSEGTYLVDEARATLRKVGETWRVDAVVTDP